MVKKVKNNVKNPQKNSKNNKNVFKTVKKMLYNYTYTARSWALSTLVNVIKKQSSSLINLEEWFLLKWTVACCVA